MCDVSKAISKYIKGNIKLNLTDISKSAKSREWFLQRIANKIAKRAEDGMKEPVLYNEYNEYGFYYFGSYFKKTKVQVVDEYDVLVVIDSNSGQFSSGGRKIGDGQGIAHPNYKYEGKKYFKSDGSGISPTKMLNWLKGVVTEVVDAFGGESPERNGQAITATIKSRDIKIDLVPAGIFKHVDTGKIFYNIPMGNKTDDWILTAPEDDMKALEKVAKDKDDFRNVIRICKRVKQTYNFQISSFAIESAIVRYGNENPWFNNLYFDCRGALSYLAQRFRAGSMADPFDESKNLISGVTQETLSWYAGRVDKIIQTLDKCLDINVQDSVNEWVRRAFENEL